MLVRRALPREWANFRKFHYKARNVPRALSLPKDHSLQMNAVVFVATVNDRACTFISIVPESRNWIQWQVIRSVLALEGGCFDAKLSLYRDPRS